MALIRILVDGYSLLHQWPELAAGQPRHSERARDELVQILTRYHDATGTPVMVFFDGVGRCGGSLKAPTNPEVEVLFSRGGRTADQMIERAVHRFSDYGEVLVVTDDQAESSAVFGMGGSVASCGNFIRLIEDALAGLRDDLRNHNRREVNGFNRRLQRVPDRK